jgi:hypothetical protein
MRDQIRLNESGQPLIPISKGADWNLAFEQRASLGG